MSLAKLKEALHRIDRARAKGHLPVVVFDLDSTILDNQPRNLRIVQEFARDFGDRFWGLEELVFGLVASDMLYDVRDSVKAKGYDDPAALGALFTFWYERFFTDEYVREDVAAPGAPEYVQACWRRGAHIYYLTARHVGGMEKGTAESLTRLGFPMYAPRCTLHMKPRFKMTDSEFKDDALQGVRSQLGWVIATFENEPGHANLLLEAFPRSMGFLRLSARSSTAVAPDPGLITFRDFAPSE